MDEDVMPAIDDSEDTMLPLNDEGSDNTDTIVELKTDIRTNVIKHEYAVEDPPIKEKDPAQSVYKQILTDRDILRKSSVYVQFTPDGRILDQTKGTIKSLIASFPKNSLGLSAPQIGIFERIFLARLDKVYIQDGEPVQKNFIFINPIVEPSFDLFFSTEGCLSLPGVERCVRRSSSVKVKGLIFTVLDDTGDIDLVSDPILEMELKDRDAAIIQHENDHLNGVLLIDNIDANISDEVIKRIADRQERIKKNRHNRNRQKSKAEQNKHYSISPRVAKKQKKMHKTYEKLIKRKMENAAYREMVANGTIAEENIKS
jgi:peptide deformylase